MVGAILGQRAKEGIDDHVSGFASAYLEYAMLYRKIGVGRDDVDVVGLDCRPIGCLAHRNLRVARKNLAEHALVVGVQMLDEDHSDPAVLRQCAHELRDGLKAARRCACTDDWKLRRPRRSLRHLRRSIDRWRD